MGSGAAVGSAAGSGAAVGGIAVGSTWDTSRFDESVSVAAVPVSVVSVVSTAVSPPQLTANSAVRMIEDRTRTNLWGSTAETVSEPM